MDERRLLPRRDQRPAVSCYVHRPGKSGVLLAEVVDASPIGLGLWVPCSVPCGSLVTLGFFHGRTTLGDHLKACVVHEQTEPRGHRVGVRLAAALPHGLLKTLPIRLPEDAQPSMQEVLPVVTVHD
jgi:hypothetical protein